MLRNVGREYARLHGVFPRVLRIVEINVRKWSTGENVTESEELGGIGTVGGIYGGFSLPSSRNITVDHRSSLLKPLIPAA